MAYCEATDLLVGDMPLPKALRPQQYVDDAADEIDSMIGFIYATPVDIVSDGTPVKRPVRLLLKRLNVLLASGRLITAMSSNSQRSDLHPYGASLIREATDVLKQIAAGDLLLPGVPPADPEASDTSTGPLIANIDAESNVESFYNRIANPGYSFGPLVVPGNSDGLVA